MTNGPPPGWYPNPSGATGSRWWDGGAWSDEAYRPHEPQGHRGGWRPRGRGLWIILAVAALVIIAGSAYLAGVGSSSPTRRSAKPAPSTVPLQPPSSIVPPVGGGYLATGAGFVDFIQWNNDNGTLSGTAQTVTTQGSAPDFRNSSDTLTVSGTLDASNISLTFNRGPQTFGTINGGSFTLDFPQSDGTLAPVTFNSASAADYNNAVTNLNDGVDQANQTAANAQAQAQAAAQAAAAASAAKAQAQLQAATPVCKAVGGFISEEGSSLECGDIAYIGTDGSTYYDAGVAMNASNATLIGPMDTDGTGATEQECTSGFYPDLSTGPGYSHKGTWSGVLAACLPS